MAVLALSVLLTIVSASALTPVGLAAELSVQAAQSSGVQLFELHCAGCHAQGGNIVRRGKTLKLKALQRYQMDSTAAIAEIVAQGKGNMSAYQDRLSPAEIQAVTDYVLEQANQNWK
ncbi:MAG: c-type cytochrome [Pegethrix bostrychoides GSE-TBD4-15B]|uniref:C-type cytochrome n=1 Tax=Pegethrix bostrychoides GSE-TBD4-15B TaxID=2839662 RepID=A0A951P6X1_9CYAN|nr:c-type cytochrome [Pegethrix bostrychoides GSE-TBD4-15B]